MLRDQLSEFTIAFFENALFSWAMNNMPVVVVFLLIIFLTWYIRGIISDYRHRFIKMEDDMVYMKFRLNNIEAKLDTLIMHLVAAQHIGPDILKSRSPIQLTDIGVKILVDMGGKDYVDNHINELIVQMEKQSFTSGLDVQNYCRVLLFERINDKGLTSVKSYLFNTPIYKISDTNSISLDLTVAVNIIGVYLRNKFFEKHPELANG